MTVWTDLLGAEVRMLAAGGVTTRVALVGEGPPVVFLHGRGGHLETFTRNLAAVAAAGYRAIAFDLLGHGLTGRPADGRYTVDRITAHAAAVLGRLGLDRTHLVGQSLGGWCAALLALDVPDRVASLVLIEPAGLQDEADRLADSRVRAAHQTGGQAYIRPTPETVAARLGGLLADPAGVDPELVQVRAGLYAPDEARQVHRAVRAADHSPWLLTPARLSALTVPALVIRGEHGHTPPAVVDAAAQAAGARVRTVPHAKQWPQYEQPGTANTLITDFLGAHP
ncbi:alpha/beta fold hydrolase [Actinomadura sp. LD22]|uniref:Alpha/beta fold hydrolase n=1 Tax=Actinomadura physcomitrii TaxID=2650748 RepID=A0A6I4MGV6_9ACTN|nr:alpha/beta hydrolase [Actinomadura physcomitrii]MWA05398.1 alpha/beta fold hydrolase [Actinomadura physcomitrii]